MSKYKVGDVLVTEGNIEFKILAVCGSVYCCSQDNNFRAVDGWFTESDLDGAKPKTDPPKLTTLSMEDVAKLAGVDVASLRIKKEEL